MSISSVYNAYPLKQEILTGVWDFVCPKVLAEKVCGVSSDLFHGGLSIAKAMAAPAFMLAGANLALKGFQDMRNMERMPRPPVPCTPECCGKSRAPQTFAFSMHQDESLCEKWSQDCRWSIHCLLGIPTAAERVFFF